MTMGSVFLASGTVTASVTVMTTQMRRPVVPVMIGNSFD